MATITSLIAAGELVKLEADLGWRQYETRSIYITPKVQAWFEERLGSVENLIPRELSPAEELSAFLTLYCAGEILAIPRQVHVLHNAKDGIWILKTNELRLFGWFVDQDVFVCTACDGATHIKRHQLYAGYRDEAIRLRGSLGTSFIPGDDPRDLLSNFDTAA